MTLNELLMADVKLRNVDAVYRVDFENDGKPYGEVYILFENNSGGFVDFTEPLDEEWAGREILSIWPTTDHGYPMLQIEVA